MPGDGEMPENLQATRSTVTGHLKRQPYGPGSKLRKWVYVSSYEARRWVALGWGVRVDVQTLEEQR